jgi:hypothetical protein
MIGQEPGLWEALAGAGPLTSGQIAERTGLPDGSVPEWSPAEAASGHLEFDANGAAFTLPPEQALAAADDTKGTDRHHRIGAEHGVPDRRARPMPGDRAGTARGTARVGPPRRSRATPTTTPATLGGDPLKRVQERITTRRQQIAVVLAMLAVAGAALATSHAWALAMALGAVVAEIALAASLLILASDRRARILELIAHGHGHLPLRTVQRERRRLLAPPHRAELARSLHELADQARLRLARPHTSPPLYKPLVLTALDAELHATARRLEEDPIRLRGIALTELLLTAHDSPLYGTDTTRLRQELHRIDFALQSIDSP